MKTPRNSKCACGSGLKYKHCCLLVERENARLAEIERRERMKIRAEEARRRRGQHLEYLKANLGTLVNTCEIDPVTMALALAMKTRRRRRF